MNGESATTAAPTKADPSAAGRLLIVLGVLISSALAGWGTFILISHRSGYEPAMQRFWAEAAKRARDEVRLVDSDKTYHRAFHRRDEGRISTLPEAMRLGYERCAVCSPPAMSIMPRRPLAWIGGIGVFMFLSAGLLFFNVRRLGVTTATKQGPRVPNAPPSSHLVELSREFESLRAKSDALLRHLTGEARSYSPQTEALSIAVLRWGARWTRRELAALKDIEHLEESVAPPDVSEGASAAEIGVTPSGPTEGGRWLQQQFEYLQLLWRAGEHSTEQARLAARKRLLDHLVENAHAAYTQTGTTSDPQILDDLTAIMAASVDFFHEHYEPDSHFRRRPNNRTLIGA